MYESIVESRVSMCEYFVFFKQKTAYEMRISDWSSDVFSSDLQGKDLPRRFQTREDEFVGMFVARGAIELRTADGPWMKGGKASYFLISHRIEFDIRTPRPSECVLGWLSFGIDNLQARPEKRRVGKELCSTCRYRWSPAH